MLFHVRLKYAAIQPRRREVKNGQTIKFISVNASI